MTITLSSSEDISQFVELFFGDRNGFLLEKIFDPENNQARIRPWVERLLKKQFTILPFWFKGGRDVVWFGIAFSEQQWQFLSDHVKHFFGPTYSDFLGMRADPVNDEIDKAVNALTAGRYIRFRSDSAHMWKMLNRVLGVWNAVPPRLIEEPRTLGRVLRDYFMALEAKNEENAWEQYRVLEQRNELGASNLLFLQVNLLSVFRKWTEILQLVQLKDLLQIRRPQYITEILIQATIRKELADCLDEPEAMIECFEERVLPHYGHLLRYRGNMTGSETLLAFMLLAVTQGDKSAVQNLLEIQIDDKTHQLLQRIALHIQSNDNVDQPSRKTTLESIREYMDQGKFDSALPKIMELPVGMQQVKFLLECAYELTTKQLQQQALEAFYTLSEEEKESLLSFRRIREYINLLQEELLEKDQPVSDWNEWFETLDTRSFQQNIDSARRGAVEWQVESWLLQEIKQQTFIKYLQGALIDESKREILDCVYPFFLQFVKRDVQYPRPELTELYIGMFNWLSQLSRGNVDDITLWSETGISLMCLKISDDQYRRILHAASNLLLKCRGREVAFHVSDLLNKIAIEPAVDEIERLRFYYKVNQSQIYTHLPDDTKKLASRLLPTTWSSWMEILSHASTDTDLLLDLLKPIEKATYDNNTWNHNAFSKLNDQILEWVTNEMSVSETKVFSIAMVQLSKWVAEDPEYPRPALHELYDTLLYAIYSDPQRNLTIGKALFDLNEGLLRIDSTKVERLWNSLESWLLMQPVARYSALILDFLELFEDFGLPVLTLRDVWNHWMSYLIHHPDIGDVEADLSHWINIGMRCNANYSLLSELQKVYSEKEVERSIEELPPQKIAIFSCREKAAKRAAKRIMERNALLDLRVCTHDRLTEQAKSLSMEADLVIVVTSCISHALTYGILPKLRRDPLYPRSSGEAGIICRLEQYALQGT